MKARLTELVLRAVRLPVPTRPQVRVHLREVQRLPQARVNPNPRLTHHTAQLRPRAVHGLARPAVVDGAVPPDGPRPQQRLAPALDRKVHELEQHARVALARGRLAERVRRRPRELRRPHHRHLVQQRHRRCLGLVCDVRPVPRAEAVAWGRRQWGARGRQSRTRTEEAVARAETAPFALWGVLGLSGWDEQVALYTEHKAVRCRGVRNDAPK